jgi:hypothetical protein
LRYAPSAAALVTFDPADVPTHTLNLINDGHFALEEETAL